jgi:hypothetical protein
MCRRAGHAPDPQQHLSARHARGHYHAHHQKRTRRRAEWAELLAASCGLKHAGHSHGDRVPVRLLPDEGLPAPTARCTPFFVDPLQGREERPGVAWTVSSVRSHSRCIDAQPCTSFVRQCQGLADRACLRHVFVLGARGPPVGFRQKLARSLDGAPSSARGPRAAPYQSSDGSRAVDDGLVSGPSPGGWSKHRWPRVARSFRLATGSTRAARTAAMVFAHDVSRHPACCAVRDRDHSCVKHGSPQ